MGSLQDKVYPFGAWILREGLKTPGCGLGSWWASHIDKRSFDHFVALDTVVHEILHCLHNERHKFYPGVNRQALYTEHASPDVSWDKEWPQRGEIYNQFGRLLKQHSMFKLYFTNTPDKPRMAKQTLDGFLTECQAYLQADGVSGAWLSTGVSQGSYSVKPSIQPIYSQNDQAFRQHPVHPPGPGRAGTARPASSLLVMTLATLLRSTCAIIARVRARG